MNRLEDIAGLSGVLTLGGKTYTIAPATPGDMLREALQMKHLARESGRKDPLKYVAESATLLPPVALAAAIAEAVRVIVEKGLPDAPRKGKR